jgi:DNA helicase-2/ATP-dependent DNA helicase PcrA
MPLVEFVRSVEQELWLDIEVQANPRRKNPMAHLNAFAAIVSGYAGSNHQPNLGGFLNWLEFADERERFEAPTPAPEAGVVQVMTVHAAKGLEWDHVAIANLIDGDFPDTTKGASGWLATGVLPYGLRGDAQSLPKLKLENLKTQPDVKTAVEDFKDQVRAHQLKEELRLMYVAVTRPKQELLLAASYWKPANAKPRKVSNFLQEAADYLQVELPQNELSENPIGEQELIETWPLDPLGEKHRRSLQHGEQKVLSAIDELQNKVHGVLEGDRIQTEIDLLLAEVEERISAAESFDVPVRIPASRFKDYIGDFAELAARYRRPMPQPPYKQTRTGTLFHGWVEQHFEKLALTDGNYSADDALPLDQDMQTLKNNFMNSRFSKLTPIDVEREIQLTVGDHTFICKLDAVFETQDGFEIVDWKTGKSPKDEADAKAKVLQLALYRLAYSKFTGVPIEKISVCFYFVAENKELKPAEVPDETELLGLWQQVIISN